MAKLDPKNQAISAVLDKALELKLPAMTQEEFQRLFGFRVTSEELQNLTLIEVIVRQLVLKACMGNDKSIQEILDRKLGKPVQTAEITTKNFNYYDFLLELKNKTDKPYGAVVDVQAEPANFAPVPTPSPLEQALNKARVPKVATQPASDPLQDLL